MSSQSRKRRIRSAASSPAPGQAVGQREGHGGVVGPLPPPQAVRPARRHVVQHGKTRLGREFDSGAHRVADGKAEQRAHGPVARGIPVTVGRDRQRVARLPRPTLLRPGLDGAGPHGADGCDRSPGAMPPRPAAGPRSCRHGPARPCNGPAPGRRRPAGTAGVAERAGQAASKAASGTLVVGIGQ